LINKPSRKTSTKFYGTKEHIIIIFALISIPAVALIPKEIRMKILSTGYEILGGKAR